jgi:alpha-galactosidase
MGEPLKVVLVGAASPQWGYGMSRDLVVQLSQPEIADRFTPALVLEDVDGRQLDLQVRLARKTAALAGGRVAVEGTADPSRALHGARFVVISFAVGTLEAMAHDLDIPQEYGVYQPVGDTISVGGAIRAVRNIPALLSLARALEAHGHPRAWIINIANPMSMLCRALTRETRVPTVGCCHELYGGIGLLAKWLGFPYEAWRQRLTLEVVGINHCGWLRRLTLDGADGLAHLRQWLASRGIAAEVSRLYNSPWPDLTRQNVKINLFLRYGVLPYSGDRHTVEFFSEFVNRATNLGADYGVLLTSIQERLVAWRGGARATVFDLLADRQTISLDMSQEAAARIIKAFLTGEPFYDVGNLPYHGSTLPGVPDGAVIERMVTYGPDGAVPDTVSPLPSGPMENLALHTGIIEEVVEAGITGNRRLLIEALTRDPLLSRMKPTRIAEMVGRLLDAHRAYVHPAFF